MTPRHSAILKGDGDPGSPVGRRARSHPGPWRGRCGLLPQPLFCTWGEALLFTAGWVGSRPRPGSPDPAQAEKGEVLHHRAPRGFRWPCGRGWTPSVSTRLPSTSGWHACHHCGRWDGRPGYRVVSTVFPWSLLLSGYPSPSSLLGL